MNDLSFENGVLNALLSVLVISLNTILAVVAVGSLMSILGIL